MCWRLGMRMAEQLTRRNYGALYSLARCWNSVRCKMCYTEGGGGQGRKARLYALLITLFTVTCISNALGRQCQDAKPTV
eukprot:52889-Prorocentrum_minimum.AAC.4